MHLTIRNLAAESEAVTSPHTDWADVLGPTADLQVEDEDADVIIIGHKPTVVEQLQEAAARMAEVIAIFRRKREASEPERVQVSIANDGANDVRVILGDGTSDVTLAVGSEQDFVAVGYIEVRELGHAPAAGGTPD